MNKKKVIVVVTSLVLLAVLATAGVYFFGQDSAGDIVLRKSVQENRLNIEVTAGSEFNHTYKSANTSFTSQPQIAIWAEDMQGNYITTLYVTRKTATGNFGSENGKKAERPESLPVWAHKALGQSDVDAVTSATIKDSAVINTAMTFPQGPFTIWAEVNNSADYNDTYSEASRESGENASHWSGQPSLLYTATILPGVSAAFDFALVGHGSIDGSDGSINPDVSAITTAKDIVSSIRVTLQ